MRLNQLIINYYLNHSLCSTNAKIALLYIEFSRGYLLLSTYCLVCAVYIVNVHTFFVSNHILKLR